MTQLDLPQQIKQQLGVVLTREDPDAQIDVKRTSLGWLQLSVISSKFDGLTPEEREQIVDESLNPLDLILNGYPFVDYRLLTPQEAERLGPVQPIQMPLWSEILMAPDPEVAAPLDNDTAKRPFVVTFYSFKGGVGRSTALGFVANI